jgi:glycine oxidase
MSAQAPAIPPTPDVETADVAVVGGGIVGLAVAWRARQRGLAVTVFERGAVGEQCATRAAAGMLAPVSEVEFGEAARGVLELGLRSARLWPDFARRLEQAAGVDVGLRRSGTLVVARDDDEARELERQLAFRQSLGLPVRRLPPSAARDLEPALAPTVRLALEAPDDDRVDPRLVLAALRRACELTGVRLREHAPVARIELSDPPAGAQRVTGVTLAAGERVRAAQVVLAAGAWTAELAGLPAHARVPVRPVKGQILRLRDPAGPGLLQRVVRFEGGYLVPRGDGRYVLGATVEERGFERLPTAGGVYELLRAAQELVPGVDELQIEELGVGFRPSTPDNAPAIGLGAVEGLVWATGHHRNGILLAPLTAALVADVLVSSDSRRDGSNSRRDGSDSRRDGRGAGTRSAELGDDNGRSLLSACDPGRFAAGWAGPDLATRTPAGPPMGVPS